MCRWDITGKKSMKKLLLIAISTLFSILMMSFSCDNVLRKDTVHVNSNQNHGGRTVTLCTISGYGPETEVNCDKKGVFYEFGSSDWDETYCGELAVIVNGVESSQRIQVSINKRGGKERSNYRYHAGSYYFN